MCHESSVASRRQIDVTQRHQSLGEGACIHASQGHRRYNLNLATTERRGDAEGTRKLDLELHTLELSRRHVLDIEPVDGVLLIETAQFELDDFTKYDGNARL